VGHACELETSAGLYLFGNLVKMGSIKREAKVGSTGLPKEIETSVDWQAYATYLYLGDPRLATEEKGRMLVENLVDFLAKAIRIIKQDTNVPSILDDFYTNAYEEQ
jgi:creatinine amidohydrolase/Fe(II)-dependent formamide hydrolase-like protein